MGNEMVTSEIRKKFRVQKTQVKLFPIFTSMPFDYHGRQIILAIVVSDLSFVSRTPSFERITAYIFDKVCNFPIIFAKMPKSL